MESSALQILIFLSMVSFSEVVKGVHSHWSLGNFAPAAWLPARPNPELKEFGTDQVDENSAPSIVSNRPPGGLKIHDMSPPRPALHGHRRGCALRPTAAPLSQRRPAISGQPCRKQKS